MLSKHIVHIVIVGEIYRDPAPVNITTSLINKAVERKQPIIFCDEENPASTIDYKLQGNLQFIQNNKKLIEHFALQPLLKNDLRRPYFPYSALNQIKTASKGILEDSTIRGLLQYAEWPERVNLWNTLKQNNIANYSIDAPAFIRQQALKDGEDFLRVENIRLEYMARNIIGLVNTQLPTGGVVIVLAGINHIPGLHATLKVLTQKKLPHQEIIIQSQRLYSKYVEDEGLAGHKKNLVLLEDRLPEHIKKSYSLEASPLKFCSENTQDNYFNVDILSSLGSNFYTDYVIPKLTADKVKVIESIFGVIKHSFKDDSAVVSIHSAYLIAPFRQLLGIDRFRLTIQSDKVEKIDYLKNHCKEMTIETEPEGLNKFLITFPHSQKTLEHLDVINKAVKWNSYLNELAQDKSVHLTVSPH